ncbi:GNAT family N-acetyltransferase [Methylobacterium sp. 4-46]|nr:GNAT family N-acetyltransferase [Methylobacterium sp. 4-46]
MMQFHEESVYKRLHLDVDRLAGFLKMAITRPDHCVNVYGQNAINGVFAGALTTPFFSKDLVAKDIFFFVNREHRGSRAAYSLWKAFELWSAQRGATAIWCGVATGISLERTDKFFTSLGCENIGKNYWLKVPPPG